MAYLRTLWKYCLYYCF